MMTGRRNTSLSLLYHVNFAIVPSFQLGIIASPEHFWVLTACPLSQFKVYSCSPVLSLEVESRLSDLGWCQNSKIDPRALGQDLPSRSIQRSPILHL